MAKKEKQSVVIHNIEVRPVNRQILDVGKWRTALQSADRGRYTALYDMYEDILTDGVLGDAVDKRVRAVTGADLTFQYADGSESQEMIDFIDTEEFEYLLQEIIKAKFWRLSLLELTFDSGGMQVYSVPRKHVRLGTKTIARNENDPDGQISYVGMDIVEVTSREHKHGILLRACPYAILKRGGIGDYAELVEIFGRPIRVGKYNLFDPESRKALQEAFDSQGGAATLITPIGTDVETKIVSGSGGTLHRDFIETLDEQMLITMLSQTMTTKDGASRSQGQVHKEVEESLNKSDLRFVQRVLNHHAKPIMERRGLPVRGGAFVFPKTLENLTVTEIVQLIPHLDIPAYYIQEKYGIPAAEEGDVVAGRKEPLATEPEGKEPPATEEKPAGKKLFDRFFVFAPTKERGGKAHFITRLTDSITGRRTLKDDDGAGYSIDLNKLLGEALKEVYGDTGNELVNKHLFQITNDALQHGIGKEIKNAGAEFGEKNREFIDEFRTGAAVFSAFKNHQQTKELVALLHDDQGSLRSFREFRKLALRVSKDYNVTWLQTEYNTAVRSARAAVNYRKWLETEHLYPNLEYVVSTASNKREAHLGYVGTVLPIRHEWWDTHMPPSDWNCACSVKPTDKPATPVPDGELVPPAFRNNPGKTSEFVKIGETPYYRETEKALREEIIGSVPELRAEYTEKRFRSGGVLQTPDGFRQNAVEEKKNVVAYTHLAKVFGLKYRLLSTVNENGVKNADALNLATGVLSDAKIPVSASGKNAVQNSIKSAAKQDVQEVYIYLERDYPMLEIWGGLKASFQKNRAGGVKEVIIAFADGRLKRYDAAFLRSVFKR